MHIVEARDPYGAALGAVRQFAEAGRFIPGEALVVTDLAAEVGLSPTPVREALACLAGEGLIERRRGRGYFYPQLTASEVIDLFELQLAFLHAALTLHPRGVGSLRKAVSGVDPRNGAQALFDAIIDQSSNRALLTAHRRVSHRLGPVLRAERDLADPSGEPVRRMIEAITEGQLPELLHRLQTYHDRRSAQATLFLKQGGR